MTLDAAAQLLATALMLLQTVSAAPALPQSVRDEAQDIAQQAITEATRAVAMQGQGTPSCTITPDKYNYRLGELIAFSWESQGATSLAFALGDKEEALNALKLDMSGSWRTTAESAGYPFATMTITDAAGNSATCSAMVNIH